MLYKLTLSSGAVQYGDCMDKHAPEGAVEISQEEHDAAMAAAIADAAKRIAAMIPTRCSRLGLKRALAEVGPSAVFPQPEWGVVKAAIESDPDAAEDWELAVDISRDDPLVQKIIKARGYDAPTVDKILVRAVALAP